MIIGLFREYALTGRIDMKYDNYVYTLAIALRIAVFSRLMSVSNIHEYITPKLMI